MHEAPIVQTMPSFLTLAVSAKHIGARARVLVKVGIVAKTSALSLSLALSGAVLSGAQAQTLSSACEEFKTVLVGRMDPSIRGYSMETLPANAPTPAGGKVIGTCEGGSIKIVYFRFGAPTPITNSAPAPATPAPAAASPGPAATPPAPKTLPPPAPTTPAVAIAVERSAAPVKATAPAEPELAAPQAPAAMPQVADFLAGKWQWLLALLTLALAGGVWAWWVHHNAYDAAGLPRGPRL